MAAIYSGIHLKLKSPQTPWEDKLKISRFAWISTQCLLPNKEQVLLDWCTHALTGWYCKKVEFSQTVLEGLWHYLDDILHSRKLHSYLKQGKPISLRLNMAQLLLEQLQQSAGVGSKSSVCVSTMLSVCQSLLSSPVLSSVFTTKYELMVDLVVKLSSLACSELKQPLPTEPVTCQEETMTQDEQIDDWSSDQPGLDANKSLPKPKENLRSARLFEVLLQALSCYLAVQRQQANPNRVFTVVTNQLLQTLVVLKHLLTFGDSHLSVRQQLCRDIRINIDSILQSALFPSEHMNFYKEDLLPSKEGSGKQSLAGAKGHLKQRTSAMLSKLNAQGYCEPDLHYSVKSNALPLLFKFFLESYKKVKGEEESVEMLCFHFLTKLVSALDLGLDGPSTSADKADQPPDASPGSPQSWNLALLAVESLLSQALSSGIYNVAADRIRHGEVQLKFYRTLAQVLFNQAQPSIPAWYRCLKLLLSLNHLILELDLDQLLSSAWVNAECMEVRVQKARQFLVCSLLQTYTKLRQLPRLFFELLSVIGQPALDNLRPPLLPEGISASLRTCLLDTPPFQILEVCSLILESIRKNIMPDLGEEAGVEEKMETDEKEDDEGMNTKMNVSQKRADASLKLFTLSQLLHVVLFSQKTLDNSSPFPLIRKCQGLMEEMQRVVNELQQLLSAAQKAAKTTSSVQKTPKKRRKTLDQKGTDNCSDLQWHQKAQEATLLLRYTLKEVDTLLYIHCSRYSPLDSAQTESASDTDDRAPPLTQVENLLSGEIFPACLQPSCSPMSSAVLKLLTLQQMKRVLLDNSLLSEPSSGSLLNRAAQFIVAKSESAPGLEEHQQEWDGQIGSVSASSYPVAHWHLITSNLPLIITHLTREDVCSLADTLVTSALSQQADVRKDPAQDSLTISVITSQLLQSSIFAELPSLFSATVHSLSQRIVGVLKSAPVCKVFQQKAVGADAARSLSSLLEEEKMVESILTASNSGEQAVQLTAAQSKELMNLFQVLMQVNPDGMNPEDLSSVFILLLFILTSTCSQDAPERGDGAVMEVTLLRMLTSLLEGQNHQSVFKLIHGGSLLQAVVSSVLWHCSSGRFQAAPSTDWLDLIKELQSFVTCLAQLIIVRSSSLRLNLDQFTSFLTSKEIASRQKCGTLLSLHLQLASRTSFLKVMSSHLGKSKPMDETLIGMISKTTASLGPAVMSILKPQSNIQPGGGISQAFMVEVVTVMLQCELSSLSAEEEEEEEEEDKQGDAKLSQMSLYQSFCRQILHEMSSAHRPMDFLLASLHFLVAFYRAVQKTAVEEEEGEETEGGKELDGLYEEILQNVFRLLTASWLSVNDICELEPAVQELLRHLVEHSSTHQFNVLLLMIREGLDVGHSKNGNYREVLSTVIIIRLLFCCQPPEPCSRALWLFAPQIISAMVLLVRTSSQDVSLTVPLTIPTVTCLTSVLRQGQGFISNPHHVILALGSLQSVPLDHLAPAVYHSAFLAVHEALFAIIHCYPQAMLNAAPSFLNVFHRLLASIMQEGRQRGDADPAPDGDVYLQCSRLVERMYSHIAVTLESFTTLSAFMVAQYVTELQKVTLRPDIKLHLTEGIYRILDLCMEHDIKFLAAGLQAGVREVFNELYGNFTHYHKAQRQGEDKYTV